MARPLSGWVVRWGSAPAPTDCCSVGEDRAKVRCAVPALQVKETAPRAEQQTQHPAHAARQWRALHLWFQPIELQKGMKYLGNAAPSPGGGSRPLWCLAHCAPLQIPQTNLCLVFDKPWGEGGCRACRAELQPPTSAAQQRCLSRCSKPSAPPPPPPPQGAGRRRDVPASPGQLAALLGGRHHPGAVRAAGAAAAVPRCDRLSSCGGVRACGILRRRRRARELRRRGPPS